MIDSIESLIRNRYPERHAEDGKLLSINVYDEHNDRWISLVRWVPDLPPGITVSDVTVTFGSVYGDEEAE